MDDHKELQHYFGTAESGLLHHAFFVEGDVSVTMEQVKKFLREEFALTPEGNADFFEKEYDVFGVDDARQLKEKQACKAVTDGAKKVFLCGVRGVTREAQNSLLKVFEEPTSETCFLLLAESSEMLLPTLRSRVVMISLRSRINEQSEEDLSKAFFQATPAERIALVSKIVAAKDKAKAVTFLNEIERALLARKNISAMSSDEIAFVQDIERFRGYLRRNSPSVKMTLEHICLTCPDTF